MVRLMCGQNPDHKFKPASKICAVCNVGLCSKCGGYDKKNKRFACNQHLEVPTLGVVNNKNE